MWIGIDPGKRGAIATIEDMTRTVSTIYRMPDSDSEVCHLFNRLAEHKVQSVTIEKWQVRPGLNIRAVATTMHHHGLLKGLCLALDWPIVMVSCHAWQSRMLRYSELPASAGPKRRSIDAAQCLFPGVSLIPPGGRKPSHGYADALLIAAYGRLESPVGR